MRKIVATLLPAMLIILFSGCPREVRNDNGWQKVPEILQRIAAPVFPQYEASILNYGAKADGITNDLPSVNRAIKEIAENGGGTILFPPGKYFFAGPIHLDNNIHLQLSENTYFLFSDNPVDYLPVVLTSWEGTRLYNYSPFIYAIGKSNVAITGSGIIDGTASNVFNNWRPNQTGDQLLSRQMNHDQTPLENRIFGEGHFLRPHLIQFYECENILIEGLTILDAPFWCLHFVFSRNIIARDIRFNAQQMNNDGIDIESCEDVLIENVRFNNNDDNIAIKSGRDLEGRTLGKSSRNIIVRNCLFKGHNALAIGSEMSGGVEHVFMENCQSDGFVRNGVYLKSNKDRGGKISNIHVRDVAFGEVNTLIRVEPDYKGEGELYPPVFENIFLERITAKYASEYGIYIMGSSESLVRNVVLKDIRVEEASTSALIKYATGIDMHNVKIE